MRASGGNMYLFLGGELCGKRLMIEDAKPVLEFTATAGGTMRYRRWWLQLDGQGFVLYLAQGLNRAGAMELLIRHYWRRG
jgi:hypothetical protein